MAFVTHVRNKKPFLLPSLRQFMDDVRQEMVGNQGGPSTMPRLSLSRTGINRYLDTDLNGRDIARECGYLEDPQLDDYLHLIRRNGLADRACHVYPDEAWSAFPDVTETEDGTKVTEFEQRLADINPLGRLWTFCHQADRESHKGTYGGLFLGMSDARTVEDLEQPVAGFMPRRGRPTSRTPDLNYMVPLHEGEIEVTDVEARLGNVRFNQPSYYRIKFGGYEPDNRTVSSVNNAPTAPRVHWSRVIHLCPTKPGKTFGNFWLEPAFNHLKDGEKTAGSSAEMFYKGGFPGIAFEGFKELAGVGDLDIDSVREEVEDFLMGLKKYLASSGGTWKSLAPNLTDPTPFVMIQVMLTAATIKCPVRVLMGSESGHLASTQDVLNWNSRIQQWRMQYLNVFVVRALIERLIGFGVLPRPKTYEVAWPDLNLRTSIEASEEALKKSQALMQYMTSGAWMVVRPLEYLTLFMSFTLKQAAMIVRRAGGEDLILSTIRKMKEKETQSKAAAPQGGGRNGKPPRRKPSRPSGQIVRRG